MQIKTVWMQYRSWIFSPTIFSQLKFIYLSWQQNEVFNRKKKRIGGLQMYDDRLQLRFNMFFFEVQYTILS